MQLGGFLPLFHLYGAQPPAQPAHQVPQHFLAVRQLVVVDEPAQDRVDVADHFSQIDRGVPAGGCFELFLEPFDLAFLNLDVVSEDFEPKVLYSVK